MAQLASLLLDEQLGGVDHQMLEQLLGQVENLSADELAALLDMEAA